MYHGPFGRRFRTRAYIFIFALEWTRPDGTFVGQGGLSLLSFPFIVIVRLNSEFIILGRRCGGGRGGRGR